MEHFLSIGNPDACSFDFYCPKTGELLDLYQDDLTDAKKCIRCWYSGECYEWCRNHIRWVFTDNEEPELIWGEVIHPPGYFGEKLGRYLGIKRLPRYRKRPIPSDLKWAVWERDNFTCQHCQTRRDLTVDHIVPEALGGPTEYANLQTLCRKCNSRKGTSNGESAERARPRRHS